VCRELEVFVRSKFSIFIEAVNFQNVLQNVNSKSNFVMNKIVVCLKVLQQKFVGT
jgi:hypothetical protein